MMTGLFVLSMAATHLLDESHEFAVTSDPDYCSKCHQQESDDIGGHGGLIECKFCHEGRPEQDENPHAVVQRGCEDCHSAEGVQKGLSTTDVLSELSSYAEAHQGMLDQHDTTTNCIACHSKTPATIVNTTDLGDGAYYTKSHAITRDFHSIEYMGDWNADFCIKCHQEIVDQLEEVRGESFHGSRSCGFCHGYPEGATNYHVVKSQKLECSNCHGHSDCFDMNQSLYPCCVTHDLRGCDGIVCTPTEDNDCSTNELRLIDDTNPCCMG